MKIEQVSAIGLLAGFVIIVSGSELWRNVVGSVVTILAFLMPLTRLRKR